MKTPRFFISPLLFFLVSSVVFAEVPQLLSYQGILTDSAGNPIADNIHAVKFRIYADSISEIAFWESDGFVPVQTTDGKYNHVLGSTSLLPDSLSKLSDLWLGVSIGLANEVKPRTHLLKVQKSNVDTLSKQKLIKSESKASINQTQADNFYRYVTANPITLKKEKRQIRPSTQGVILKVGADVLGKHKISGLGLSGTEDVKVGMSLGLVLYLMDGNGTLRAGVGGDLQISREQQDFSGDFNFNSLFFTFMAHPSIYNDNVQPFVVGKLGYNFFGGDSEYKGNGYYEANLSGGILYGIGVGFVAERIFQVDVMYSVNNGNAELLGSDLLGVIIDSKEY